MNNDSQETQKVTMEPETSPEQSQRQLTVSDNASSKKNRKKLIAGIAAVIVLLLIGGVVAAYNLWYQHPQKVVTDSIVNVIKAKSITLKGSMNISGDQNIRVEFDGSGEAGKVSVSTKVTGKADGKEVVLSGSGLMDDKGDLYLRAKGIDVMLRGIRSQLDSVTLANFDKLISKVDDKWVKIALSDTKLLSSEAAKAQECSTQVLKKFESDKALANELSDLYKKNEFINIDEKLGSKDGSLGYKLSIKKDAVSAFVNGLQNTKVYKMMHDCDSSFALGEADFSGENNKSTVTGELWVSRWSHEVTQFHMESTEGNSKTMIMLNPQFNKTVTVTAPSEYTTVDKLKADFEALFMSGMSASESEL